MAHQPEGAIAVMSRRLGQNLVGGTSTAKALDVEIHSQLPLQFACVEMKSALALTQGSAFCWLYQADQKGEVERPGVIRKWRMKGEEKSLLRDGNSTREPCLSSSGPECHSEDA